MPQSREFVFKAVSLAHSMCHHLRTTARRIFAFHPKSERRYPGVSVAEFSMQATCYICNTATHCCPKEGHIMKRTDSVDSSPERAGTRFLLAVLSLALSGAALSDSSHVPTRAVQPRLPQRVRFHEIYRSVAATRTHRRAREATDIRSQPHSNCRNTAARCRERHVFASGDGYR
jgi:hypothetical protein